MLYVDIVHVVHIEINSIIPPIEINSIIPHMSATLAQWGERSLSERTAQVLFPVRPDKTYTVFC